MDVVRCLAQGWPCEEDPDASPLVARSSRQKSVPADTAVSSTTFFSANEPSSSAGESSASPPASTVRSQWRLLTYLSAGHLLDGFCVSIQLPFYPHEASRRGLSNAASSAVFSCLALTKMLVYPVMGWLAPRLGVTRLYTLGLLLTGIATVVFGLLADIEQPTPFLAACLAVRAAEAVGTAATLTAGRTLIINCFLHQVNTALGVSQTVAGVGLLLGPVLGGGIYALAGYGAPFYTLGALLLAAAAGASLTIPAATEGKTENGGNDDWSYRRGVCLVLSTPDNWLIVAARLAVAIDWAAVDPNMEPYVQSTLNISPAELNLFFLACSISYALSSPVWGRLSDAVDNTFLLVAGCLAPTALGVLLIPPSPLLGLEPSRLLLGLGMTLREVFLVGGYLPLLALMMRCSAARGLESDVRGQALVSAVYGAVYSLGQVLGPVGGGLVTDWFGFPALATGLGAVTATVCLVMTVRGLVYHVSTARRSVS